MIQDADAVSREAAVARRTEELFRDHQHAVHVRTDRLFLRLMIGQWVFAILLAVVFSPYAWEGTARSVHVHVYVAIFLGGALSSLPIALAVLHPGATITRHVIAVSQMLWSALLIHLSGGRIETHFHVFGSLAFLAFYRDWKVLVPATIVVAADHLVRQLFWPMSVYGIVNPEWWRFLEHAFWVAFEDIVLVMSCVVGIHEMKSLARGRASVELLSESEQEKSAALNHALVELRSSQETLVRTEKLAAVGQLAASVGHELRNPLAAVRNANTWLSKRIKDGRGGDPSGDPKVAQFLGLVDRELAACTKIISDLLDFARERPLQLAPCPMRALVEEALGVVPPSHVRLVNEVSDDLPVPNVDRDQYRQMVINLAQNAVEAMPADHAGQVVVRAEGGGDRPLRLIVEDDGPGMPADVVARIFEPLFTTKTKGTGLGLAIVASVVKRHHGTIHVDSQPGHGTRFVVELPPTSAQKAA